MTDWHCIGWTDAHAPLKAAFSKLNMTFKGYSTAAFMEESGRETDGKLIIASAFMHYPDRERSALLAQFTRQAVELINGLAYPQIIFLSSASVYGLSAKVTSRTEGDILQPRSAYGREKFELEKALSDATIKAGGQCIILRPAGLFGKFPEMKRSGNLVDRLIETIWTGETVSLSIESNGEQLRDFIHVNDLIAIIAHLATKIDKLAIHTQPFVLNVSNGLRHTIKDVVEAARERTPTISVNYLTPSDDAIHCTLDVTRLAAHFNIRNFRDVLVAIKTAGTA